MPPDPTTPVSDSGHELARVAGALERIADSLEHLEHLADQAHTGTTHLAQLVGELIARNPRLRKLTGK